MPAMSLKRDSSWMIAALLFGALLLPFLVYYTGVLTLGPYSHGGPLTFYADFLGGVVHLRGAAWMLLLGPATLVVVWRLLVTYAWRSED